VNGLEHHISYLLSDLERMKVGTSINPEELSHYPLPYVLLELSNLANVGVWNAFLQQFALKACILYY
jgi:hypothetical protein